MSEKNFQRTEIQKECKVIDFRFIFSGSSGDEMDSTHELQNNAEVPNGLEVIPLNMQDHYLDRIKVSSKLKGTTVVLY